MSLEATREDALRYVEQAFDSLSEAEKDTVIASDGIQDLTPRLIHSMVHDPNSQAGKEYLDTLVAVFNYR